METNNNYKDILYNEVLGFLNSIFIIDTISFDNIKQLEPLTCERIFNNRCKSNQHTMVVFDKTIFAQKELREIEDYISDLEKFAKEPSQLLTEPM